MPESPEDLYARIVDQVGAEGRLPVPPVAEWEMFPWEIVDGELVTKVVPPPPLPAEPVRVGAVGGATCPVCAPSGDGVRIWKSWNFHVTRPAQPSGIPLLVWLNSNEHLDYTEAGRPAGR